MYLCIQFSQQYMNNICLCKVKSWCSDVQGWMVVQAEECWHKSLTPLIKNIKEKVYFFACCILEKLPVFFVCFFQSYRPTPFCPYPSLLSLVFCLSLYCISFYLTLWIYLFILSRQLGPNLFWKKPYFSFEESVLTNDLSVCYPFVIRLLSSYDPIPLLSFLPSVLSFQLRFLFLP